MKDIKNKMRKQVPEGFLWLNVFLPAFMAIPSHQLCMAVQAIFFFSFFKMRHASLILTKITLQ